MKKFLFMLIACMAMMSANAQTFESSKFFDNTYLRLEGGATALTHPDCNNEGYGYDDWAHTIQGVVGVEMGKWITPKFGVAFEGDFGLRNGSKNGYFNYESVDPLMKAKAFNYINVTGLAKMNMSNVIAGWNPNRKVEFVLATGPMWIHGFPGWAYENDLGVKFKAEVNVNVAERWQINFIPELNYNLTGLYCNGTYEHPKFDSRNSWYGLKAGVTYKIGKQFTECPYTYTQADVDALNDQITELRNRKPEVVTQVVEKVVEKVVYRDNTGAAYVIEFAKGSSELTEASCKILDMVSTDVVFDVSATASPEGSKAFNDRLSKDRAYVVAAYLKNRGVTVNKVEGLGVNGENSKRQAIVNPVR